MKKYSSKILVSSTGVRCSDLHDWLLPLATCPFCKGFQKTCETKVTNSQTTSEKESQS